MTKENALIAYKNAIETGDTAYAEDILIRHPDFKDNSGEESEKKPKKPKEK